MTDCPDGYYGKHCNEVCPPGSYGFHCAGRCSPMCNKEECYHISGCPNTLENLTQKIVSGMIKIQKSNRLIFNRY